MELLETRTEEDLQRTRKFIEASKISQVFFFFFIYFFIFQKKKKKKKKKKKQELEQEEEANTDLIEAVVVASVFTQFFELARRNFRVIVRNPLTFRARLAQTIVMSLLVLIFDIIHFFLSFLFFLLFFFID